MSGPAEPVGQPAPAAGGGRRSRLVLWACLATAAVVGLLVAVLAYSGPAGSAGGSSPLVGRPAPPLSGKVIGSSRRVSLSDFGGKWVLVNFAASWCVPCRQETPQLLRFAREHAGPPPDAVVLAVAYDESDLGALSSFLSSSGATWPAVDDGAAVVSYGVGGIPESFLVDPAGTVVAKYTGGISAGQVDSFIARAAAG